MADDARLGRPSGGYLTTSAHHFAHTCPLLPTPDHLDPVAWARALLDALDAERAVVSADLRAAEARLAHLARLHADLDAQARGLLLFLEARTGRRERGS